jgi:hypothetical protein
MPRQSRIDAPGALHHIIFRGIERREIFIGDLDRNDFVSRLATVLVETSTCCFAWKRGRAWQLGNYCNMLISNVIWMVKRLSETSNGPQGTLKKSLAYKYDLLGRPEKAVNPDSS